MRKFVLAVLLSLVLGYANAQTHRYYCEVKSVGFTSLFIANTISINFGTQYADKMLGNLKGELKIVDENGEDIQFSDMVDAGNYLSERGWQLQQAYFSNDINGGYAHYWIFYKDAESHKKAMENILIKVETKRGKK